VFIAGQNSDKHGLLFHYRMDIDGNELTQRILATLTETERQQSVVYLDTNLYPHGSTIRINRQARSITEPTVLAFIDLRPGANWGHPCRYLLLHPEQNGAETIEASFPPNAASLTLIYRSENIQNWMLLTNIVSR
jgi:hypothetical protein